MAHLSRTPWLCPIGLVVPGVVPVVDVIICPDAAQTEDVCERRVNTHVKQRGAGYAEADKAMARMRVFSAVQASISCHAPRSLLVVQPIRKDN